MSTIVSKQADLAGPGIGDYEELEKVLPQDYNSLLNPKDTQQAITILKRYIEDNLCRQLNLIRVEVPLIVDVESGVNDYLDRDGSRTPVEFHISNDNDKHPVDAQIVQAATKWKRVALKQFGMMPVRALSPTCAQCVRITSLITIIAPMWTSGIGRKRSSRTA